MTDDKAPDSAYDIPHFKIRHPDISHVVHVMLGVYTTQHPEVKEPVNLEEAYEHVTTCEKCKSHFDYKKQFQEQFIQ